MYLSVVWRDNG
jgi:hypothetical protein